MAVLLAAVFFSAGCAKTARIKRCSPIGASAEKFEEPARAFTVGERLTYLVAWKGIPVGEGTATVEDLTDFKGREVYKIVIAARTNKFLSKLFRVEDTFTSYMDKDKLASLRYEAIIREGNYKKDLVVDYDFQKGIAVYKNLRDGSVKVCPVEKGTQDPVSAAYFFRTVPARVGDRIKIYLTLNEKNYEIVADITKKAAVEVPELGAFNAFLIKPFVKLEGKRQRRGSAWGYLSADKKRLVLFAVVKVLEIPWIGEVTATLKNVEYLKK